MKSQNQTMKTIKLAALGIAGIIGIIICLTTVRFTTIEGNQYGILETWTGGVSEEILQPKTHVLFPGFMKRVYKYNGASQVFVMNNKTVLEEKVSEGRARDAYLVQSREGQDMTISLNLRWRLDPTKLVMIHKTVRDNIEEKIIRPVVMRVVKDSATKMNAIDAYSGEGLVRLQMEIQNTLSGKTSTESQELADRGVIVENFVIEHIELDPKYIEEIKQRQIATQRTLRAVEEEKAAQQEALVARAKAQADLNTQVVAAERDAQVMVINAQAENEKVIIAAKAAAEQVTIAAEAQKQQLALQGEGQKLKQVEEAEGVLAMGKAEAEAKQLLFDAWNTPGIDNYVVVQVAGPEGISGAFKNIQGYIPESMRINVLSTSFVDALKGVVGNTQRE